LLDEKGAEYAYRDYRKQPLSSAEVRAVLRKLDVPAASLLRRNDRAYKELGLRGDESDAKLVPLIAENPTLLQRPIGIKGRQAVVGRPPEALLELAD
jgi:arsenate reductase